MLSPEERAAAARRDAARARRQSSREARRRHRQWDRDTEDAEAKTLAPDDQPLASLGQAQASETGGVAGVSLNGWLQLEEWFYSQDAHSLVDATEGTTQGVVFLPCFRRPSLSGSSGREGDLAAKRAASVGGAQPRRSSRTARSITAEDVAGLREQGFDHVPAAHVGGVRVRADEPSSWRTRGPTRSKSRCPARRRPIVATLVDRD